jgi:hypothetical protein
MNRLKHLETFKTLLCVATASFSLRRVTLAKGVQKMPRQNNAEKDAYLARCCNSGAKTWLFPDVRLTPANCLPHSKLGSEGRPKTWTNIVTFPPR